jgi:hypothetical protein
MRGRSCSAHALWLGRQHAARALWVKDYHKWPDWLGGGKLKLQDLSGSEAGARRAAVIYSLVASCKLNEIDPFMYFRDVLARVSTYPTDKIDELLPNEWKKLNTESDADVGGDITMVIKVA